MRKFFKVFLILILLSALLGLLFACGETSGDGKYALKPDLAQVFQKYNNLTEKRSDVTATLNVTYYQRNADNEPKPYNRRIKQGAKLTRIQKGEKLYFECTAGATSVDAEFISLIDTLSQWVPELRANSAEILGYLTGGTNAVLTAGYYGGSYNLKGKLNQRSQTQSLFWIATDDTSVNELLSKAAPDFYFAPATLMFSTFFDLTQSGVLQGDKARNSYVDSMSAFIYDATVDGKKVKEYISLAINQALEVLGLDIMNLETEKLLDIIPILVNSISVKNPSVDAKVNKQELPISMKTTLGITLGIPKSDLDRIIDIVAEDKIQAGLAKWLIVDNLLRAKDGGRDKIDIDIDIVLEETFAYDKAKCSLDDKDGDLFLSAFTPIEGRKEYLLA